MRYKNIFSAFLLLIAIGANSQQNFHYNPIKPEAGDSITFYYEPTGEMAHSGLPVEAVAYISARGKRDIVQEISLTREGKKYHGTIRTEPSQHFMYLLFSSGDKIDNNSNEGFWIQLYEAGKVKKGANQSLVQFYSYNSVGVERNYEKALKFMEAELAAYPERRKE